MELVENEVGTRDRILLEEQSEIIEQIRSRAEYLADIVNDLLQEGKFKTIEDIPIMAKSYIIEEAKKDKKFAELYAMLEDPSSLKIPDELKSLERKLDQFNSRRRDPEMKYLNVYQKHCTIDFEMLDEDMERYRKYAETPEQLKRYELAGQYVEIIKELNPGNYHVNKFNNPLIFKNPYTLEFEINKSFVLHGLG